jgi:DUF4097 and DUF4098 domain-containing protein YvlB
MIRFLAITILVGLISGMGLSTASGQQMITVFEANDNYSGITKVNIQGKFCRVKVLPAEGNNLIITSKIEAMKSHEDYKVVSVNENNELTLSVQVPQLDFASHAGEIVITPTANLQINIENTSGYIDINGISQANITASTSSGKITAAKSDGTITLQTKSGSIDATNLKGTVSLSTASGNQFVMNLEGTITLDSPDGPIIAENIKGKLNISTIAGSQTLTNIDGEVNQKCSSGAIKISNSNVTLTTQSLNGSVNLFGLKGVLNVTTTKGLIAGTQIKLTDSSSFNTTEGKIKIKFDNKKEELSFVLRSQNAPLIAMGSSKMKKLNTGSGPIVVTGTSTTGGQNYN